MTKYARGRAVDSVEKGAAAKRDEGRRSSLRQQNRVLRLRLHTFPCASSLSNWIRQTKKKITTVVREQAHPSVNGERAVQTSHPSSTTRVEP